jgi:hypothetical protein
MFNYIPGQRWIVCPLSHRGDASWNRSPSTLGKDKEQSMIILATMYKPRDMIISGSMGKLISMKEMYHHKYPCREAGPCRTLTI